MRRNANLDVPVTALDHFTMTSIFDNDTSLTNKRASAGWSNSRRMAYGSINTREHNFVILNTSHSHFSIKEIVEIVAVSLQLIFKCVLVQLSIAWDGAKHV